jgi:hypothetical protein
MSDRSPETTFSDACGNILLGMFAGAGVLLLASATGWPFEVRYKDNPETLRLGCQWRGYSHGH